MKPIYGLRHPALISFPPVVPSKCITKIIGNANATNDLNRCR